MDFANWCIVHGDLWFAQSELNQSAHSVDLDIDYFARWIKILQRTQNLEQLLAIRMCD
jgi:hypothetical protein